MQRQIFIGIDLPPKVKKRLQEKIEKWAELPVKWGSEDNFHITLLFLGYIDNNLIFDICQKVRNVSSQFNPFDLNFDRIELAPNMQSPKMIWFTGEPNENLKKLQENLEKELDIFQREKKSFRPHVTLGRIRKTKWEALAEKPEIGEKFLISVPIESIKIFESRFENGKRKYIILEDCALA